MIEWYSSSVNTSRKDSSASSSITSYILPWKHIFGYMTHHQFFPSPSPIVIRRASYTPAGRENVSYCLVGNPSRHSVTTARCVLPAASRVLLASSWSFGKFSCRYSFACSVSWTSANACRRLVITASRTWSFSSWSSALSELATTWSRISSSFSRCLSAITVPHQTKAASKAQAKTHFISFFIRNTVHTWEYPQYGRYLEKIYKSRGQTGFAIKIPGKLSLSILQTTAAYSKLGIIANTAEPDPVICRPREP